MVKEAAEVLALAQRMRRARASALLVCGPPGHGKTTLCQWLMEQHDYDLVSVDALRGAARQRYTQASHMAELSLRMGRHVLIEACAVSPEFRAYFAPLLNACVWLAPDWRVVLEHRPHIETPRWWWEARTAEPSRTEGFETLIIPACSVP